MLCKTNRRDPRRLVGAPLILAAAALGMLPAVALAQRAIPDLSQISIEDLMRIEVTGAGRKEQQAVNVAAAVYVITNDDIRQSGLSTLPDVLRLAPGVEVAQINANKWAVSIRGFNEVFANKLLVLVDGRNLYNRLFSGVLWDAQNLMLDDVDHIEIIRGPGASLWGANAVNGVINIITKSSADTAGGLVRVEGGGAGEQAAVRYGGAFGAANYRVYAQWTGRNESLMQPGTSADDASRDFTTGVRFDKPSAGGDLMFDSAFTAGQARALFLNLDGKTAALQPIIHDPSDTLGVHVLGRWTRPLRSGASLQVQSFVDFVDRQEPVGDYHRHAFEFDAQFHTVLGARQDLVTGATYQYAGERLLGKNGFTLVPADNNATLITAFIQDEISFLDKRLLITAGTQVRHDPYSGFGMQPTARAMWKAADHQRLWTAVSRALRTPSLTDRGIQVRYPPAPSEGGLPVVVTAFGNPAVATENFVDAELGYRLEIGAKASVDVAGFVGHYDHLITNEPGEPVVQFTPSPQIIVSSQFSNQLEATTRGLEVAARWAPAAKIRFDGTFTTFRLIPHPAATSRDPNAAIEDGSAPRAQWRLGSTLMPSNRVSVSLNAFHAGALEQLAIDAYTRVDLAAEWRFTSRLSVMAIGQNLLESGHTEFSAASSLLQATQLPRSASLRLRWSLP